MDYYDGDIEDDAEVENVLEAVRDEVEVEDEEVDDIDYDDYLYRQPLDQSCITDVSSRSGSFHNSSL